MEAEQLQLHIQEWKNVHENVYQVMIQDKEQENVFLFIYRNLGREEYKQLLDLQLSNASFQEEICKLCTLYPIDYKFTEGLAGIPESLANAIIDSSAMQEGKAKQLLDQYRAELEIFDYQVDCMIHEAFPEYTIPEIQSWSIQKTMYYLSRAEYILSNLRGVQMYQGMPEQQVEYQDAPQEQYQYTHTATPERKSQEPSVQEPNVNNESDVMAMLAANEAKQGRNLNQQDTNMHEEDVFPEMAWFKMDDYVKGDFE